LLVLPLAAKAYFNTGLRVGFQVQTKIYFTMSKSITDYHDPNSLVLKARRKRFDFFLSQLNKLKRPVRLLDVGGTQWFWEMMDFTDQRNIEISLLNLSHQEVEHSNFKSLVGDATNMKEFDDNSFDLVFSNSVIEHLFTWDNQVKMANEIQRVGRNHFIQTPNYWFPIEPHFVFPLFQYLPKRIRVGLISNFSMGHHPKYPDREIAVRKIDEVKLLSIRRMKQLFPNSNIYLDKFMGFNKSIVAYNFSDP
jgi:hypothetical protein